MCLFECVAAAAANDGVGECAGKLSLFYDGTLACFEWLNRILIEKESVRIKEEKMEDIMCASEQ